VRSVRSVLTACFGGCLLSACSSSTGPGDPAVLTCTDASLQTLAVGEFRIVDPSQTGACVRLPAAGSSGAEHLYVALSTVGGETAEGISAPFTITATPPVLATRGSARRGLSARSATPGIVGAFHGRLRSYERTMAERPGRSLRVPSRPAQSVPLGTTRTFEVLASATRVDTFVHVTATAVFSGLHVSIFLDSDVPAGGYSQTDINNVGNLFDDHLYGIDTLAFGAESDIDNNGQVLVLLSDEVNKLGDCTGTASQAIAGFFFAGDLRTTFPHSNGGEVFYGWVPGSCGISLSRATTFLPEVFVHEFQHMISFNQHVMVAGGTVEDTWLNEGLSAYAEELAARSVPADRCVASDCIGQFASSNLGNAAGYLSDPSSYYLVVPGDSVLSLPEYGATWLFTRWLVDHFAAEQPLGADFTRRLLETTRVGAANVEAATGKSFGDLVGQWQLANFLDNLPGVVPTSSRLQYKSWDFRAAFGSPYPLQPDTTIDGRDVSGVAYTRSGSLLAGSGVHVLIGQSAGAAAVDFQLTNPDATDLPAAEAEPRIALFRIR
jgi:hypothetical protein